MSRTKNTLTKRKMGLEEARYVDRSCSKKRKYHNKKVAEAKARDARDRSGEVIEPYRCRLGQKHYHIGHRKGSR